MAKGNEDNNQFMTQNPHQRKRETENPFIEPTYGSDIKN